MTAANAASFVKSQQSIIALGNNLLVTDRDPLRDLLAEVTSSEQGTDHLIVPLREYTLNLLEILLRTMLNYTFQFHLPKFPLA